MTTLAYTLTDSATMIRRINAAQLPPGYPVDTHFNPPYAVWDQRL